MLVPALVVSLLASLDPDTLGQDDVSAACRTLQSAIITQHHAKRYWDPVQMPPGESVRQHRGGYTALACLALLTSGADPQSVPLRGALMYLADIDMIGTYAVSFRAQVWALLPDRYLPNLQADVAQLTESFHHAQGGWDYLCQPVDHIPRVSPSTRHVAILALHAAAERGVAFPHSILHSVEAATLHAQLEDGGWGYHMDDPSTGSMTSAGVFTLVLIDDLLKNTRQTTRRLRARQEAIDRGLAWLDERFYPIPCPGGGRSAKFPMYWLYSLERVALATGCRTLAARDWLRDASAAAINRLCTHDSKGNWKIRSGKGHGQLRQRCFALMLLHRARLPLAAGELCLDGSPRPTMSARLVGDLRREHEQTCTWQRITMSDEIDAWLESPMLIMSGRRVPAELRAPRGSPAPLTSPMQEYLRRGGLLVVMSKGGDMAHAVRTLGTQAAPHATWRPLDRTHPVHHLLDTPRGPRPRMEALSTATRDLIVMIHGNGESMLANLWAIATERSPFPPRISEPPTPNPDPIEPLATLAWRIDATDPEPGAPDALDQWCRAEQVPLHTVRIDDINAVPSDAAVVLPWTAPHSEQGWHDARSLLDTGHVVLIACSGASQSQLEELTKNAAAIGVALGTARGTPLMTGHALMQGRVLNTRGWRAGTRQDGGGGELDLLIGHTPQGGTLVIAPSDVIHALLNRPQWGIRGLDTQTARNLMWNIAAMARGGT